MHPITTEPHGSRLAPILRSSRAMYSKIILSQDKKEWKMQVEGSKHDLEYKWPKLMPRGSRPEEESILYRKKLGKLSEDMGSVD